MYTQFLRVVALLAVAVGCFRATAQPLTDRLPASTLVYLGWSPNASLQTTATAKMLADERFMSPWRRLFQEALLELPDANDGGPRISAELPQLLMDAAQCEGCFALLELKQQKRYFNPQSVLMVDLGAKRKTFEEHFKPLHLRMKDRAGDKLQMMKLQNSWVWFKPDKDGKAHVTWGFVGDMFVIYQGDGAEEFIPRLVKGNIENPLKSAAAFVNSVGKIEGESVFTTYLDTKGSLAVIRRLIEREGNNDFREIVKHWDTLLPELGLDNVQAVAEKTTIVDKQFVTKTLVRTDGPVKGLLEWIAQPVVDEGMMKIIPADAMVASAVRLDPSKAWEQIKSSIIKIGGNDAKEGIKQLEQGADGAGLPVKDVLDSLGDQWVLYSAPSQGGFAFTGWTLSCNIRDVEKFKKTADTVRKIIAKAMGGEGEQAHIESFETDGVKIEFLEFGRWGSPIAPAWAIAGDKFVISLYPQVVEDAVRHIKSPGKSILDNADYVAARKRTGDAGPMIYINGPEITKNLYPVGLVLMQALNNFGGFHERDGDSRISASDLVPSFQRLLQYVGHDALSIKSTPDGLLKTRSVTNPLLSPLAWGDSPVVWLAVGIPTLGASEETADRVQSASNLRQIGQAIMLYANENKGAFPPDLGTVIKTQDIGAEVTKSPFGPAKDGQDIILVNHIGKNPVHKAPPEIVMGYDQALLEQGEGTNVLYADGHVEFLDMDGFKKAIEESRKKAALLDAAP